MLSLALVVSFVGFVIFLKPLSTPLAPPLRKIPNAHWSSRFSSFYIIWQRWRQRENATLLRLHQKLGPIVLLSPHEISVNDVSSLRTIYVGGWEKSKWYLVFRNYANTPNMFTMLDRRAHAERKRLLSGVYSKSSLLGSPGVERIKKEIISEDFIPWLQDKARSREEVEGGNALSRLAMDGMSAFIFGRESGTRYLHDQNGWDEFERNYAERGKWAFLKQELPGLENWIGFAAWKSKAARHWVDMWCMGLCDDSEKKESYGEIGVGEAEVWRALKKGIMRESNNTVQEKQLVASEVLDQLLAGHETTAIALTFCMYHLSVNLQIQTALREELLTLNASFKPDQTHKLPTVKAIDMLPLLSAIVTETLRLNAPIPGPQPRMSFDGAFLSEIGPLPKGIRVSANAMCLHRNEDVFPEAERWIPWRWIQTEHLTVKRMTDIEKSKEMQRWWWAFSSGGKMCIGSNFALLEMKLILAALYTHFQTTVSDATGIEQRDGYTVGPLRDPRFIFSEV